MSAKSLLCFLWLRKPTGHTRIPTPPLKSNYNISYTKIGVESQVKNEKAFVSCLSYLVPAETHAHVTNKSSLFKWLQVIRMALGPGHHAPGLRIADDGLFALVPLELSAEDI